MKKELMFHTLTDKDVYCVRGTYGTKLRACVSGYIYLLSKRRLFGFIPLPDKLKSEIELQCYDITGAFIPNSLLPEFTPEGRRRIERIHLDIEDQLKEKRKTLLERFKKHKTWHF